MPRHRSSCSTRWIVTPMAVAEPWTSIIFYCLPTGGLPRGIPHRRTTVGLNSKLHAVCDGCGRPPVLLLSEVQMSDYKGAALMIDALPKAGEMLGNRGLRRRLSFAKP